MITIDDVEVTNEVCPDANDGTITVTATGTGLTGTLEYSIDGFTTSNTDGMFTGLADNTYTVSVRDAGNNSCNAEQTGVEIMAGVDAQNPTANCPTDITVNNDPDECGAVVNFTIPPPTDNCLGATSTASIATGSFFNLGTTQVTVTATDATGLTGTCNFNVTVNSTGADEDGDGVSDACDLDDDNDGILDTEECAPINFLGNSSMESYTGCPDFAILSTINNADGWESGGGQLMVNDPGTCVSNKPGIAGWPASTALSGGSDGMNWLGMHTSEFATNTLTSPIPNGLSCELSFDAGYVVADVVFVNPGVLQVFGVTASNAEILLGSASVIIN